MRAAALAALSGLIGLFIGRIWDLRSESARWRRDQRVKAYERFGHEFSSFYEATRAVALAQPNKAETANLIRECRTVGIGMDNALVGVWLHGSPAVASKARSVDDALSKLFITAQKWEYSESEWNVAREEARLALETYVDAVRIDLGLPKLGDRMFWAAGPLDT